MVLAGLLAVGCASKSPYELLAKGEGCYTPLNNFRILVHAPEELNPDRISIRVKFEARGSESDYFFDWTSPIESTRAGVRLAARDFTRIENSGRPTWFFWSFELQVGIGEIKEVEILVDGLSAGFAHSVERCQ